MAIIVAQHLSGHGSTLVDILRRRINLPVEWITEGCTVEPGHVYVCPPRKCLEVLPDGTCSLKPNDDGIHDMPLSFFLESLADSCGERTLAVVLTGMGKDGSKGALAVKQAGGMALVQSEDTAEQPYMPRAAINAGAADLVLPLHKISIVITSVVSGGKLPRPQNEIEAAEAMFQALFR